MDDSWDFELMLILLAASRGGEERRQALQACQAKCRPEGDEWHSEYLAEKCGGVVLEALGRPADEVERGAFIAGNMHLDVVRNEAISLALREDDFETAERLAREGMDLAEKKQHPGTADEYADRLVEAQEARGDGSSALAFIEARVPAEEAWAMLRERILGSLPSGSRHFMAARTGKGGRLPHVDALQTNRTKLSRGRGAPPRAGHSK